MQLMIAWQDVGEFQTGDIVVVQPDSHLWGASETMGNWLGAGNLAANFPLPSFSIAQFPSEPCDLNLSEPWLAADPLEPGSTIMIAARLWKLDLAALPPGARNSLTVPGGMAQLGANRRSAIVNKATGNSLPLRSDSDGNTRHRSPGTDPRLVV